MFYIGIDIAKNSHEVCFLDEIGNVLDGNSFKIANTASGVDKLQKMFGKHALSPDNSIVGMEATGHYWLVLYSWLVEKGFDVKVINPIITDAYRNMLIRKTKNDRIDAQVVAKVLMLGEYQESPVSDKDTLALRQFCRFRLWQVQSCADLKKKVIALLDQIFPEYEKLFSDVFGLTSKEILKNYTSPEEIASINTRKLTHLLEKASKGRFGKEKALEIKAVANHSLGIQLAIDAFSFQLRQLIEQIEFVEQQIALLISRLKITWRNSNHRSRRFLALGRSTVRSFLPNSVTSNVFPVGSKSSRMQVWMLPFMNPETLSEPGPTSPNAARPTLGEPFGALHLLLPGRIRSYLLITIAFVLAANTIT